MFGTMDEEEKEVVNQDQAHELLDEAWTLGIHLMDTANHYARGRSEAYLGEWLAGKEREDLVIVS